MNIQRRKSITLIAAIISLIILAFASTLAQAATVQPVVVTGNPSCTELGYEFGFKIDPVNPGTYTLPDGVNTITITVNGSSFDWTSTIGIDAVIVKGGTDSNLYVYDPPAESFGDTGLQSTINPANGQPFDLSHIEFCYDVESPTNTPTNTSVPPTNTPTDTPTNTPSNTPTNTPTDTPTNTSTNTPTD